ncbi:ketopantoate reductase [Clostridium acetobutylicum]|nr:ketopantoate reductase [Clostridium acetobutylicum]
MKVAVIGAGAMGGLYGAYLSRKNDVYMIDINEKVVKSINENGLIIYERERNKKEKFLVSAFTDSSNLGPMDLVIIFVKNLYTTSALKNNLNLFSDSTLVITLQNGAGNDKDLEKFIKKENILIGTTEHSCSILETGEVSHNQEGITNIGMLVYNDNIIKRISDEFEACSLKTEVYQNIQEIIWSKLFINMALNSTTAILNCKVGYLDKSKDASEIVRSILSEAVDVAIADGTFFNKEEVICKVQKCIREDLPNAITSMNQDVSNKRLTEIDHINGAVANLAKLYKIPTPYNDCIIHIIHALEGLYNI